MEAGRAIMKYLLLIALLPLLNFSQAATDPAVEGPKIIAEAFAKLSGALGKAIGDSGPAGALSVCSEKAPQIAKEVAAVHGVTLRRATNKQRNPKNAADDVEKAALEIFAAALAKRGSDVANHYERGRQHELHCPYRARKSTLPAMPRHTGRRHRSRNTCLDSKVLPQRQGHRLQAWRPARPLAHHLSCQMNPMMSISRQHRSHLAPQDELSAVICSRSLQNTQTHPAAVRQAPLAEREGYFASPLRPSTLL